MNSLLTFILGFYAVAFVVGIIILIFKAKERIVEKPKDDSDLEKFDKY